MIDLFYPYVPREAVEEVADVLRSRFIGQGPKVETFEKAFCKKFGIDFAASVNSGTSALETAYDLIGLKEGDEVISTPLTCTATNLPLLRRGVKIVWADILPNTLCIDPIDVRGKITENTKAIIQVHLGGIKADVGMVHIPVVSDAAQALGIFNGTFTCCSFQAIKHLTTIDGGMFCSNGHESNHRAKLLRWFGINREVKIANNWQAYTKRAMTFDIEELGTKRHMHDVSAVMGIVGLKYYDDIISHRKLIFNIYKEGLQNVPGIKLIDGLENKYWLATVLVENREGFAEKMFEGDVDTNLVQVRNDVYKVFGGKRADLPVMNELEDKYISIPLTMKTTVEDAHYIVNLIKRGW